MQPRRYRWMRMTLSSAAAKLFFNFWYFFRRLEPNHTLRTKVAARSISARRCSRKSSTSFLALRARVCFCIMFAASYMRFAASYCRRRASAFCRPFHPRKRRCRSTVALCSVRSTWRSFARLAAIRFPSQPRTNFWIVMMTEILWPPSRLCCFRAKPPRTSRCMLVAASCAFLIRILAKAPKMRRWIATAALCFLSTERTRKPRMSRWIINAARSMRCRRTWYDRQWDWIIVAQIQVMVIHSEFSWQYSYHERHTRWILVAAIRCAAADFHGSEAVARFFAMSCMARSLWAMELKTPVLRTTREVRVWRFIVRLGRKSWTLDSLFSAWASMMSIRDSGCFSSASPSGVLPASPLDVMDWKRKWPMS
mmetsp:Transcript_32325/g.94557  ORF Transcript_32325/g.94557 Transcript_32325/m.94557 type:complete len:366 (-) Transcript_32325:1289-2386(-)